MIDPMVSLAFAVYSNKGTYALLLGSGISRASGIPTGWEVVIDLIRKVARLEGADCEPDPAAWFRTAHGADPDYSQLLDAIAKTPTERQQLLRGYFEPTSDERDQGLKLPSQAHKAIARLVAAGYLRVIITTNFDRLTENALEEEGIVPTIISTTDQIDGALPLAHSGATVIKLHGDYLDTRIKNTEQELAEYAGKIDRLLDRVFDEYGLIVSGWSGDWDIALRAAIERCPNRRFTTFWTTRSPLSDKAGCLVRHSQAVVLQVSDADHLFGTLQEKVLTLEEMNAPHPLSPKIAEATLKRYLVDPSAKIRLHDLVHEETERLYPEISGPTFSCQTQLRDAEEFMGRVRRYDTHCEIMISIVVTGCYWGDEGTTNHWTNVIQRIANRANNNGMVHLLKLSDYPALLLIYAAGLASVASGNYGTLAAVLTNPRTLGRTGKNQEVCAVIYPMSVIESDFAKWLLGHDGQPTEMSSYLFAKLRGNFREYLPRDEDYQAVFERFEYLFGLVHADITRWSATTGWWGPVGLYLKWERWARSQNSMRKRIDVEIESEGTDWPLLKAGLFGRSLEQLKTAKFEFDAFLDSVMSDY